MIHVALFEPEIPPNTGNIIRLCANSGAKLHLIEPLGFDLDDKRCRRAGLDYRELANVARYKNWETFLAWSGQRRLLACSTKATQSYANYHYTSEDILLFGPETRGLPQSILTSLPQEQLLRIPMRDDSRSLNLSNATAIILYEAWRCLAFPGMR